MKLINQKKRGLFAEHNGIAPVVYTVRATVPAAEALHAAGAVLVPLPNGIGYEITLGPQMPANLIACQLNESPHIGVRCSNEPEFPGESPDYWASVNFSPCPVCGSPVVWYEAGYVPGYRVCTGPKHHHSLAE
jgi:hypothetical protein